MRSISLKLQEAKLSVVKTVMLTSGTVNDIECLIEFSDDWSVFDSLIAVFIGSGETKSVEITDSKALVPWECLKNASGELIVGVSGLTNGVRVRNSNYISLGIIQQGSDPEADPSAVPTPSLLQEITAAAAGCKRTGVSGCRKRS